MFERSVQDKILDLSETYDIEGRETKGANGWIFYATNKVTGVKVAIKSQSSSIFGGTSLICMLSLDRLRNSTHPT